MSQRESSVQPNDIKDAKIYQKREHKKQNLGITYITKRIKFKKNKKCLHKFPKKINPLLGVL